MTCAEREWLDLVADLLAAPLTAFPAETIALRLRATFALDTVSYDERCPGHPRTVRSWPGRERRRDPPAALGHALLTAWSAQDRARERLEMPVHLGPREHRIFLLAREAPFVPAEVELAGRLQRLIAGLDRQVCALAAACPAEPPAPVEPSGSGLTPRELSVLTLVAHGLTAAAVARRLDVAERTVHKHLERVYTKLGVGDRVSAVLAAQRRGELREVDPSVLDDAPTG
jgi:DNA-binding CsgD family transcriptional regulator